MTSATVFAVAIVVASGGSVQSVESAIVNALDCPGGTTTIQRINAGTAPTGTPEVREVVVDLGTVPVTGSVPAAFLVNFPPAPASVVFRYRLAELRQPDRSRGYYVEVAEPFWFTWHAQRQWPWAKKYDMGALELPDGRRLDPSYARTAIAFAPDAATVREALPIVYITRRFCNREFRGPGFWMTQDFHQTREFRVRNLLTTPYTTLLVVNVFGPKDERQPYMPVPVAKDETGSRTTPPSGDADPQLADRSGSAGANERSCVGALETINRALAEDDALTGRDSASESAEDGPLLAYCKEPCHATHNVTGYRATLLAMRGAIVDARGRSIPEVAALARSTGSNAKYSVYTWPAVWQHDRGHGLISNAIVSLVRERALPIAVQRQQALREVNDPHIANMRAIAQNMCFLAPTDTQFTATEVERMTEGNEPDAPDSAPRPSPVGM